MPRAKPKPRAKPLKTMTFDDFMKWASGMTPDGVEIQAYVSISFRRNQGCLSSYFMVYIELTGKGQKIKHNSHDLTALAVWMVETGLPFFEPKPPPRPLRKLTQKCELLESHALDPLW